MRYALNPPSAYPAPSSILYKGAPCPHLRSLVISTPFLHVSLRKGEKLICESGAMVMMETPLDLQGKMSGGFGRALMRRLTTGESFFQQHIEATRGDGDCLLSPMLPGAIQMLEVGPQRYTLNDGAFVAATAGIELTTRTQQLGNALFAQSGGLFVLEASGKGSTGRLRLRLHLRAGCGTRQGT
jgi:uncharacterized protein (AIM24 family)